jgi:hypothetical protein
MQKVARVLFLGENHIFFQKRHLSCWCMVAQWADFIVKPQAEMRGVNFVPRFFKAAKEAVEKWARAV